MSLDIEATLRELAQSRPVADDAALHSSLAARTRHIVAGARRRRAVRHVAQATTGVAACAGVALLATQGIPGLDSLRAPGGESTMPRPATALSERAGARCGEPFDPAGKSDPRFAVDLGPTWNFSDPQAVTKTVLIWHDVVDLRQPTAKPDPARPATAVFMKDGTVVGIADALTDWERLNRGATAGPGDDTAGGLSVPANDMTNCTGTVPSQFTSNMFDLILLSEYQVDGETQAALVISEPVKGPLINEPSTYTHSAGALEPLDPNSSWSVFIVGETDQMRGDQVEFKMGDYLAVADTPGANVPLYYSSPDGSFPNGSRPYTGPAEAHVAADGSLAVTLDGQVVRTFTKEGWAGQ